MPFFLHFVQRSGISAIPAATALTSRSFPTYFAVPQRVSLAGEAALSTPRNIIQVKPRQIHGQQPFMRCPEFFGNPPKLCFQCGGDNAVKGTCDRILVSGPQRNCPPAGPYDNCYGYFCKRSDARGPENSPKVTSTAVVDGQAATAVWEPLTLTAYRGLKALEQ